MHTLISLLRRSLGCSHCADEGPVGPTPTPETAGSTSLAPLPRCTPAPWNAAAADSTAGPALRRRHSDRCTPAQAWQPHSWRTLHVTLAVKVALFSLGAWRSSTPTAASKSQADSHGKSQPTVVTHVTLPESHVSLIPQMGGVAGTRCCLLTCAGGPRERVRKALGHALNASQLEILPSWSWACEPPKARRCCCLR